VVFFLDFDTVVISGAEQSLKDLYHLTPWALVFTVTSALIGTIIGSLTAGIPGDAIGRRDSLRFMAVFTSYPPSAVPLRGVGRRS